MKLHVTSTAFNAGALSKRCIQSVANQTFQDWEMTFIDADSTDLGSTWANAKVGSMAAPEHKVTLSRNPTGQRKSILENLLPLWRRLPQDDVVVWLDGDDELATRQALQIVADRHASGALVTYGQFLWEDGRVGFAAPSSRFARTEPWRATHLKTFRAGLTRHLRDSDLQDLKFAGDQAVMLAMLEMVPEQRAHFIDRVLYVFNSGHSLVENTPDRSEEYAEVARVRALPRYNQVVES